MNLRGIEDSKRSKKEHKDTIPGITLENTVVIGYYKMERV